MAKNELFFHETFQPESKYLSDILKLSDSLFVGNKYEISDKTGIPTGKEKGKVEPHIKYASYMGLIEYSYKQGIYSLTLTDLGQEVFSQDCHLHEPISLWLLHYQLSSESGALNWKYVVRNINRGFNNSISSSYFSSSVQEAFNITEQEVSKFFGVVKNSYVSGLFSRLDYLDWGDSISFHEKRENMEYSFLYAYVLLDSWQRIYPAQSEITFTQLVGELLYGKILGFNNDEIDSVLESLEDLGIIKINRQLYPITIIKLSTVQDVIGKLYSLLM